jgi:hypothetical protein
MDSMAPKEELLNKFLQKNQKDHYYYDYVVLASACNLGNPATTRDRGHQTKTSKKHCVGFGLWHDLSNVDPDCTTIVQPFVPIHCSKEESGRRGRNRKFLYEAT